MAHIQEGDSLGESSAKRSGKDSVFCDLFLDTARILRAYRENLHPEPSNVTAQDIIPVALRPVLVNSLRNDLAFLVKERLSAPKKRRRGRKGKSSREIQERYRLIILVEAQATWTLNILIRFVLYLASEYQQFIKVNEINLFGTKLADLPEPEFYVVYCGPPRQLKERISLREDVFRNLEAKLDLVATVIHDPEKGGILGEYIKFCRVLDQEIQKHGRTMEAVEETIRICEEQDVLREYLERKEKEEVFGMMRAMFTEKDYQRAIARSLREAEAKGREKGKV